MALGLSPSFPSVPSTRGLVKNFGMKNQLPKARNEGPQDFVFSRGITRRVACCEDAFDVG